MPAIATLEELRAVQADLGRLRERYPEAYGDVAALLKAHRKVGYRNIAKLLLGEATPEQLKGGE